MKPERRHGQRRKRGTTKLLRLSRVGLGNREGGFPRFPSNTNRTASKLPAIIAASAAPDRRLLHGCPRWGYTKGGAQ